MPPCYLCGTQTKMVCESCEEICCIDCRPGKICHIWFDECFECFYDNECNGYICTVCDNFAASCCNVPPECDACVNKK